MYVSIHFGNLSYINPCKPIVVILYFQGLALVPGQPHKHGYTFSIYSYSSSL